MKISEINIFCSSRYAYRNIQMKYFSLLIVQVIVMGLFVLTGHAEEISSNAKGKKVLYINAYHAGYAWSDNEQKAAENALMSSGAEFKTIYMETKTKNTAEQIKASAENVRKAIESFKPDVVIASDDNPVKLVLVPWYKNSATPFVFCGVNWECADYGLPCKNVTGMLEISLIPQLLETVRPLANGDRIAMLANDNETDRKEGEMIPKKFNVQWSAEKYVKTFEEWQTAYRELQDAADIIFWYGTAGIKEWNDAEAEAFVLENTKIITCSTQYYMKNVVLVGYMKSGEEQGDWAARTALRILNGISPADIPVTENKIARKTLNMKLAKRMNIVFPIDRVKHAELIK
jgi:ABC-type uncharacterized transport system substrate-binding protein